MSNQDGSFKGFWIHRDEFLDTDLVFMEKMMLSAIKQLDKTSKGCFASNNYFADLFDITPGRASQLINSLKEKGYINVKLSKDGKITTGRTITVFNKLNRVFRKLNGGIKYSKRGYLIYCEGNSKDINNKDIKKKNTKKKKEPDLSKVIIPDNLNQKAWTEWMSYKQAIKKQYTSHIGINKAMKNLSKIPHDNQQNCIDEAIGREWEGFFTDRHHEVKNANKHNEKRESEADRINREATEAINLVMGNHEDQIPKTMGGKERLKLLQ